MSVCAREGCERYAPKDDFCSTVCAKLFYGTSTETPETERERRNRRARVSRLRKKHGSSIVVENTDAMNRLVGGSVESGKQGRKVYKKPLGQQYPGGREV